MVLMGSREHEMKNWKEIFQKLQPDVDISSKSTWKFPFIIIVFMVLN